MDLFWGNQCYFSNQIALNSIIDKQNDRFESANNPFIEKTQIFCKKLALKYWN